MPIADAETRPERPRAVKLVRVEVEVPEDAVEGLLAHVQELRGEPLPKAKDFKAFLTAGPAWTDELIELVNARDKRPARDIDL